MSRWRLFLWNALGEVVSVGLGAIGGVAVVWTVEQLLGIYW